MPSSDATFLKIHPNVLTQSPRLSSRHTFQEDIYQRHQTAILQARH